MDEGLSRRDVLKILTFGAGAVLLGGAPRAVRALVSNSPEAQPGDWFSKLPELLGNDYSIQEKALYFHKPTSNRDSIVLVKFDEKTASFNVGPDMDAGTHPASPKETVRWVKGDRLYVLSNPTLLAAVDTEKHVYTFDVLSKFWQNRIGNLPIAGYKPTSDGLFNQIMTYDKSYQKIPSGWSVDSTTGALVNK